MADVTTLAEACRISTGKLDANAAVHGGSYPFFTCAETPSRIDSYAYDGCVILVAGNNAQGRFHVSRYDGKFNAYQRTYILEPRSGFERDYLYYSLKLALTGLRGSAQGSQTKFLTMPILTGLALAKRSLTEQRRAVAILSALDAKIDLNNRINADLEALAKTIYDYWFVQFDFPDAHGRPYKSSGGAMVWNDTLKREIPVGGGWAFGTLGEVIQLVYGKPLKESDRSGTGFPVMGSNGVVGYHKEFLAEGPGIVVGRKGTAGAISYSHENFFPIDTTFYVTPRRDYGFNFLLHLLRSLPLTKLNSDSAVPGLNRDSALRLPVLLPPDDLVKRYDMLASTFEAKLKSALFENRELTQLRDWLLPLLMNGQVRVA